MEIVLFPQIEKYVYENALIFICTCIIIFLFYLFIIYFLLIKEVKAKFNVE